MLAKTISRPVPDNDDGLSTQKKKAGLSSSQPSGVDIRFGVNGNRADLATMGGFSSASSVFSSQQPTKSKLKKKSYVTVKSEVQEESDVKRAKLQKTL